MAGDSKNAVYTPPAPPPVPGASAARPAEDLQPKQTAMLDALLAHFSAPEYTVPGAEPSPLTEAEKFWLSRECLLRFLRAIKWSSAKEGIDRVEATLKWRREFGLWDLSASDVEPESVTGKEIIYGYDTDRRPALYLIPSRQNTDESPRQIQFVVWMLERTLDLAGPGVESISLMINFADRAKNPSFSTSKTVLNILQTHYPERLGRALILNVPWALNMFFSMIKPFIDPRTREKMRFNPRPVEESLFVAEQLFKDGGWGGAVEFEWAHEKYWPALLKLTAEVRAAQLARWRALGGRVGLSEWDFKQDVEVPAAAEPAAPAAYVDAEAASPAIAEKADAPQAAAAAPAAA